MAKPPIEYGGSSTVSKRVRAVLATVVSCWPHSKVDEQDTTGVWSRSLDGLTDNQVRYGVDSLSKLSQRWPVSPGEFREICLLYVPPRTPDPPQIRDNSAKTLAWRACQVAFSRRVCGESPAVMPATDFDYEYVVDGAALPKNNSLQAHKHAWESLKRRFEEEWLKVTA